MDGVPGVADQQDGPREPAGVEGVRVEVVLHEPEAVRAAAGAVAPVLGGGGRQPAAVGHPVLDDGRGPVGADGLGVRVDVPEAELGQDVADERGSGGRVAGDDDVPPAQPGGVPSVQGERVYPVRLFGSVHGVLSRSSPPACPRSVSP
ncbi:hypothetical protein GCM10020221_18300 [Streptomyces thioluteus]|uniref:Uncharacterized protein n=1 Tax=Streptomyces thioluteus TaxID=66431 RepID=A0ABN3WNK0_STRTU